MKQATKYKDTEIGKIPQEWEVVLLRSLSKRITKGTTPTTLKKKFTEDGINFIKVESMGDDGFFDRSKFVFIDDETNDLLDRSKFEENDILYTIAGTIGRVAIVSKDILPANTNQAVAIIRPKEKVNIKFLRYSLINPKLKDYLVSKTVQAVQANLSLTELGNAPIICPSDSEQQAIAKILSDLDAKIELNQEMNRTLEAVGHALFKQWFVDFEFPNEKGRPYKSSGGKMIESELGEIPEGWKVKELTECGEIVCGKTPPTSDKDNYGEGVSFITIPDMRGQVFVTTTERKLSFKGAKTQEKKELPELSVCVSCIATPGLVGLTSERSHTNQQINSIICNGKTSPYFMYLSMLKMSEQIKQLGLGGTATLNLNTGDFSKIKITCPSENYMKVFHSMITPIFNKLLFNINEINSLSIIRDSLLPRLMSGRIRVNVG